MRIFFTAFTLGVLVSIPALAMFHNVGASPYRNFNAVIHYLNVEWGLFGIFLFYGLTLFVPAFGSAVGAKLGGRMQDMRHIYRRGIVGQVLGSIIFGLLIDFNPAVGPTVEAMSSLMQTAVTLIAMQFFCTLGTAWGF